MKEVWCSVCGEWKGYVNDCTPMVCEFGHPVEIEGCESPVLDLIRPVYDTKGRKFYRYKIEGQDE